MRADGQVVECMERADMELSRDRICNKLMELPEMQACLVADLKSETDCDAATNALDQTVDWLAFLRSTISRNKAHLANKWVRDNLMTGDESAAIISELSGKHFYELPADSCFFAWLKKFYSKFLANSGSSINLVNAYAEVDSAFADRSTLLRADYSTPRQDLTLWFAHDAMPKLAVVIGIPLPGTINPMPNSQKVLSGVNVYVSEVDTRHYGAVEYNGRAVFLNECNLALVKNALQKSICIGKTDELVNFTEFEPKYLYWKPGGHKYWWSLTDNDFDCF